MERDCSKRVVITGLGVLSPLGFGVERNWAGLCAGESGIRALTAYPGPVVCPETDVPCKVAGTILEKDFPIADYVDAKERRKLARFMSCGIVAAAEAVNDSGIVNAPGLDLGRVGVCIGSGIGGLTEVERSVESMMAKGYRGVGPLFIPLSLINLLAGHVSIMFGFKGPSVADCLACATGASAIVNAAKMIVLGEADAVIAGGAESCITPLAMSGFSAMKALTSDFNNNPQKASRPWDKDRSGFVMSEGAGVLVLESYEHAKARGAKIYAEIIGWGLSSDAYHIAAPNPEGSAAAVAMRAALKGARIGVESIDYINAHATSTVQGDASEVMAIKSVFGLHAGRVLVSSTKSSIGHLLGAAGAVEAVYAVMSIVSGAVPPTLNLEEPSEGLDLDFIPKEARAKKVGVALSNSFGFGGANVSILFSCV